MAQPAVSFERANYKSFAEAKETCQSRRRGSSAGETPLVCSSAADRDRALCDSNALSDPWGTYVGAIIGWIVTWWITEPVPIPLSALLGAAACVIFGRR